MDNVDAYRAYLLRVWRDVDPTTGQEGPWRFSLERPGQRDRRGFRSLPELAAFFQLTLSDLDLGDGTFVAVTTPHDPTE